MRHVYAYTARGVQFYPEYVSLQSDESGDVVITIRSAPHKVAVGSLASIRLNRAQALEMAAAIQGAAPKDAPNESRCTHKSSKIMRGIDNTYDVAWCDDCGAITWASDGYLTDEELHRSDREKWCESRVLAWGCAREADGANACKWWCGHPETCAVTLRTDGEMAEKEGK